MQSEHQGKTNYNLEVSVGLGLLTFLVCLHGWWIFGISVYVCQDQRLFGKAEHHSHSAPKSVGVPEVLKKAVLTSNVVGQR